jgi:hypothetical protein
MRRGFVQTRETDEGAFEKSMKRFFRTLGLSKMKNES